MAVNEQELDNIIRATREGADDERTRRDYTALGNARERVEAQRVTARQNTQLMSLVPVIAVIVVVLVGWMLFSAITHRPDVQVRFDKPASANSAAPANPASTAPKAFGAVAATAPSPAAAAGNAPANSDTPHGWPLDPARKDWQIYASYQASGGGDEGAVVIAATDRPAAAGTPVHATHAGMVKTMQGSPNLGNIVYVIGKDYTTIYAYLATISVADGSTVKAGDRIGTLGDTGSRANSEYGLNYQVWRCSGAAAASGTAARQCQNVDPSPFLR